MWRLAARCGRSRVCLRASKGARGQAAALVLGGLRCDRPALFGLVARRIARCIGFALCARTDATSQMTNRATSRAATNPAMLGACQVHCGLPGGAFAGTAGGVGSKTKAGGSAASGARAG